MSELQLEVSELYYQPDKSHVGNTNIMITPPLGGENWVYRVRLDGKQSMLGFKKFMTIGIGFDEEDDWNTNLPWSHEAMNIWNHIKHNKGSDDISDENCIEAIKMIQVAVEQNKEDLGIVA